jgi:response regulator RpfG family c-di-GMP phosphodiesterase
MALDEAGLEDAAILLMSLGEEEARRRLVEASRAQFDPQVVDALLRVLDAR